MKNAVVRRCAVGAATLALALGPTACGTNHTKNPTGARASGNAAAERSGKAQATKPTAGVLTQDQLERAVVNKHDLPGLSLIKIGAGAEGIGDGVVKAIPNNTHPATCAPVSAVLGGGSSYTPVGSVVRSAKSEDGLATLYLVSYREADAVRVIDDLHTALRTCKAFTAGPMKVAHKDIRPSDDPSQGDDGVSFRLTWLLESPGEDTLEVPQSVIAIRSGSTVAVFTATSDDAHTLPKIPADLVNAQSKVLASATHATP